MFQLILTLNVDRLRQPHDILYKEIIFKHIIRLFEDDRKANTCIVYQIAVYPSFTN